MGDKVTYFEIETTYKSGRKRNEVVVTENEESMWKWYRKHHDTSKVAKCMLIDGW